MTRIIKYLFCVLTICVCQLPLLAQQKTIDSLLIHIKTGKVDTNKLNDLNNLRIEYYNIGSYQQAMGYADSALQLSNRIIGETSVPQIKKVAQEIKIASYNKIGLMFKIQGNYAEALKNYFAALKIIEVLGNKKSIAASYNNIGNVYYAQGNYPEALKNHFASLKLCESIDDKEGVARSYNNIGNVYDSQGNYAEALKNHVASLKIKEVIGDKEGIVVSYANIGSVYANYGNYPEALKNYFASLKMSETTENKKGIAANYNNIGTVYEAQGNYPEALKNHFASLKIKESMGDKAGIASSYGNIGLVYTKQKNTKKAEEYLIKSIALSKILGYKEWLKSAYKGLAYLDSTKGNFKEAYENHKLHILYRDSLDNEETRKNTIQNQMTYDFEKKEAVTQAEQDKKDIIAKEELKQKEQQRNYFVIGFVLVGLLALFILRGYKQKQKANFLITQQKTEVEKQKELVEEKNKEITDSINYAKRIQQAKLPKKKEIYTSLPQSFVLFKPKDIISGDFYFFHNSEQSVFIAAADCTGHGVPGALMSMIGSEKLEDAVSQTTDTSQILKLLNRGIKSSLHQSEINESTRDGMDIALCSLDKKNRIVKYAGANRPIWIIRKGQTEVEETKATKKAIGGFTEDNQHFETHELKLEQGDTFYIFTDGYADQFGGEDGKKLMTKKLKEILLDIQSKTMQEQEKHLDTFVENWRGKREQIDDILVIGVRL